MDRDISEKLLNDAAKEVKGVDETVWDRILIENKKMWAVAGPAIFTRFTNFGTSVISQAFVGHIGSTELAAYALVFTVFMRFANGILLGMASGLETLCGQAYGAKQYHMLGIYLQRSWIVLFTFAIFLLPLFIFTTPILKALGQDEAVADVAGTIAHWFIPIIFSYVVSFTSQMFLQAQSRNRIIAYVALGTIPLHLFMSWLLTMKFKFGIPGAMTSTILAYWIPNIGQLAFILFGGCKETWKGFSVLAFEDLGPVVKLSLSSGVMICLEVWYNTILVLLTGNMENAEIAIDALSICLNISGWEIMIALGFLAAASVRVANELGRGDAKAAKFAIVNIVLTSLAIGIILFVFFIFFRGRLAYIFTNSPKVADAVEDLSILLACSILFASIQPVLSGVSVGVGRQSTVAYVNIVCYYIVGIPVGALLGFVTKYQVKGVWAGMLIGTFVQTAILIIITYKTDWDKQVTVAQRRVNKWVVKAEQPNASEEQA